MNVLSAVSERYSKGAKEKQQALCCAVDYDSELLRRTTPVVIQPITFTKVMWYLISVVAVERSAISRPS